MTDPSPAAEALRLLPVALLFANSFLVYRLLDASGLAGVLVEFLVLRSRGRLSRVFLGVIGAGTLLSFFIPNAVSVLTLLPVIRRVRDAMTDSGYPSGPATTALTLLTIYGANIGGMGSLIGSPANLLLLGALAVMRVPGREQVTFAGWFVWSLPLVAIFVGLGYGLILLYARRTLGRGALALPPPARPSISRSQRRALRLVAAFFGFWIVQSGAAGFWPLPGPFWVLACLGFLALFCVAAFRSPSSRSHFEGPLLRPADLVSGLPRRGLAFLLALGLLVAAVRLLGLDDTMAGLLRGLPPHDLPLLPALVALTLAVILLTEVFSNTLVAVTFFGLAPLAVPAGTSPLLPMLAVSLASTCAFMTPVATPCNALAFGEMRGTSLRVMLGLGLAMNLAGALLMSLWLWAVLPLLYDLGI